MIKADLSSLDVSPAKHRGHRGNSFMNANFFFVKKCKTKHTQM